MNALHIGRAHLYSGFRKVRLLTNNPDQVRALVAAVHRGGDAGPMPVPENVHNREYLRSQGRKGRPSALALLAPLPSSLTAATGLSCAARMRW